MLLENCQTNRQPYKYTIQPCNHGIYTGLQAYVWRWRWECGCKKIFLLAVQSMKYALIVREYDALAYDAQWMCASEWKISRLTTEMGWG